MQGGCDSATGRGWEFPLLTESGGWAVLLVVVGLLLLEEREQMLGRQITTCNRSLRGRTILGVRLIQYLRFIGRRTENLHIYLFRLAGPEQSLHVSVTQFPYLKGV